MGDHVGLGDKPSMDFCLGMNVAPSSTVTHKLNLIHLLPHALCFLVPHVPAGL